MAIKMTIEGKDQLKIRHKWKLCPATKVFDVKTKYKRREAKKELRKIINEAVKDLTT